MSRIKTVLTSSAILLGSSAALLTGGIAKAEPAPFPVPTPNVPGLSMIQGLMDPAKLPQMLQAASSVLTTAPAALSPAAATVPAAPAPLATATLNGIPGITPAAAPAAAPTVPATGNTFLPANQVAAPGIPGVPQLGQFLNLPGDIAALMPGAPATSPVTYPGVAPAA
ncbi:MAG TPA: hypothetical protein PKI77_15790, partial [Mycobacterium sp.]|nr:hypothetical protein [Mycobacterium sp.]